MSIPPSEFRRRAQELIAERSGAPAADVPVDLQLPATPQEGGAMSADMAALLGGAPPPGLADTGGPPGPDALAGGPGAPPAPTGSVTSRDEGSDLDHIRTAIQALQIYAEGNHDDVELAKVHKCIVALQSILADHAKNRDAAMGTAPAMKHIRRTSASY